MRPNCHRDWREFAYVQEGSTCVIPPLLLVFAASMTSILAGIPRNTTFGEGPALLSTFNYPKGIAIHVPSGDVFIVDSKNCLIRLLSNSTGYVTTVAGAGCGSSGIVDGPSSSAVFSSTISGIAVAANRDLFVTEGEVHVVRKVSLSTDGRVSTVAGQYNVSGWTPDGPASASKVYSPIGITLGPDGNSVYWAEVSPRRTDHHLGNLFPRVFVLAHGNDVHRALSLISDCCAS